MGKNESKKETLSPSQMLNETIRAAKQAQLEFSKFSQKQVDKIFMEAALSASSMRIELAVSAATETGMGITEDKVIKNHFASEFIYNKFKDAKTCGIIENDKTFGIMRIAEPIGVLAGVIPTTNPTSTTIFKALLALKTRNAIIFSPHPRAKKCTCEAAKIVLEAAVKAGAPKNIISWIEEPSVDLSKQLMNHEDVDMILATGGPGMVKSAYSSGKPAIGVGAGNTPAVIDETANIQMAVNSILLSKTFDNGMICASEQSVIVPASIYDKVREEFKHRGACILTEEQCKKVRTVLLKNGSLNPEIVGQPAWKIAKMADVEVPKSSKVLIGEVKDIGTEEPFSYEKLSPVLALYKAKDCKDAFDKAEALVQFGGIGHTSVLYTDFSKSERAEEFGQRMKTGRVLINQPASQGAIGDMYNFHLEPSLTLGCGSWGGNSVSENVGVKHLLNIKTVADRRENMLWFRIPEKVYFKRGCLPVALSDLAGKKRAFIVTDKPIFDLGMVDLVTDILDDMDVETKVFYDVLPDPDLKTVYAGAEDMKLFKPDVIIALGGGSPMDAAKIMWLLYEHPDIHFQDMALRFLDIRKRVYQFPKLGEKATMVAIPTTSGTGSEVTPFAVITDEETGKKYPIADYELTPDIAICDSDLVRTMPKALTAYSGIDALTHALEAIAGVMASDYTNALALESIRILVKYLPRAYNNGEDDILAREKVHNAATMAGMAFANAFLGVCHSMAHKLGAKYDLPHGLANALLINEVIRFNASEAPTKQTAFPQYEYPDAINRYARVAAYLGLHGKTDEESIEMLINEINKLKKALNIPMTIREAGVEEQQFLKDLDDLSIQAFDDQCTGGNPRFPLISEIKDLYMKAYDPKLST
jgi:acetaldehyde dehydrogenase/alcohol dehydrogenase